MILSGGWLWLRSVFGSEDLQDMPALLEKIKKNTPVYDLVGFLFYQASMVFGVKEGTQTSDVDMLDFLWTFSLRVYAATGKNQYKTGCVCNHKIYKDSEQRVRYLLRHCRTVNDSGRPCAGMAIDMKNEKVRCPCLAFIDSLLADKC